MQKTNKNELALKELKIAMEEVDNDKFIKPLNVFDSMVSKVTGYTETSRVRMIRDSFLDQETSDLAIRKFKGKSFVCSLEAYNKMRSRVSNEGIF